MAEITKIKLSNTAYDIKDAGAARTNHTHDFSALNNRGETYLQWGGQATAGTVSPIGCALSAEHSANKLAFISGNAITIE